MQETLYPWNKTDKPCLNHWYRVKSNEVDYWKIIKDFHSPELNITYYKIIEYYNGDIIYCGKTLAAIRLLMRTHTWKKVL